MEFAHTALDFRADDLSDGFARAFKYWQYLRDGRGCPSWRELDMMALPLRLVPWCSVIDVIGDGDDFVFRFFGTARVRLQGRDYTGRSVKTFDSQMLANKVIVELTEVLRRREPMLYRTTVFQRGADGSREASYEVLRLPFSSGDGVDVILNIADYASMSRLIYDWLGVEPPIDVMRNGQG